MTDPTPICGKVAYPSRRLAVRHQKLTVRHWDAEGRDRHEGAKLVVYRCRVCRLWHLGNDALRPVAVVRTKGRRTWDAGEG